MPETRCTTLILALVAFLLGCATANEQRADPRTEPHAGNREMPTTRTSTPEATAALEAAADVLAVAEIAGLEGRPIRGEAVFARIGDRVDLVVTLEGAPPGPRAFHIHEGTDCDAPGGHWNPTGDVHGRWGDPEGFHLGDVGNVEVAPDGTAFRTHSTDLWALGEDIDVDPIGQVVILHEGHDTFEPPTGHAGAPIACGKIERVPTPDERPEPAAHAG